ncbi:unnamed protein product [Urochloa humidicola]
MAMASYPPITHFTDPHHWLQETQYSHDQPGRCSFCLLNLAGHRGYGCYTCNIHLHRACAGYFGETISFFAHPSHALKLSRSPGRICDICREDCPRESFVYRCIGCGFDVHPLCAMLPERFPDPFHPGHDLCTVSSESPGHCLACHHPLLKWRYICSAFELHVACAIDPPTASAAGPAGINGHAAFQGSSHGHGDVGQRSRSFGSSSAGQGWYPQGPGAPGYNNYNHAVYGGGPVMQGGNYVYYPPGPVMHGGYGTTGGNNGGQGFLHNPGRLMSAIARFLVRIAISTVVSDFASQLLSGG